jgi:hypothetical protein
MKKAILYFSVLFVALSAMECEPDPMPVTGVTVTPSSVSMVINTTRQLTAEVEPANVIDNTVTWSTSNAAVATVSATGLVSAKMVGNATITATTLEGGYKSTCTVTVTATAIALIGVTLNKTSMSLAVNGTETLTATVAPANATNKNVTWSSSNSNVATVSTNGLVTAKAAGTATITVTTQDGGKTAQCTVTVTSGGGGGVTGKRIKTILWTSTSPIDGPVRFEHSYNSNGTTKYIDAYDESSRLVIHEIITSNPDGTWAKLEQTDIYSGMLLVLNHTYDANKKPLKHQGTMSLNGVETGTTTFDFIFQNGRKTSQKQKVFVGGILVTELNTVFNYDSNGRRTTTTTTPSIGTSTTYTRTAYNSDGTLRTAQHYIGSQLITMTFTWENGNSTMNMDDVWGW